MYLTRHSDYTMRLLIHLALRPDGTATIREIAGHYGISRNHLMKVANHAVQAGFVVSLRGRDGGLKLAKAASKLKIGEVLRTTEEWMAVECFDTARTQCPIQNGCGLRPVLKEALNAYFDVLDRYSLADVARKRTVLVQLLGMKTA
ncbi:MAG: Rrf2 family transcriptional regulator [Acidobacteriaceae bacterium]